MTTRFDFLLLAATRHKTNRSYRIRHTLAASLLLSTVAHHVMAAPATGEFVADKRCELFQSKNKQTNPDQWQSNIGQSYAVVEILGQQHQPDWVRIRSDASLSPLRWIRGNCGQYHAQGTDKPTTAASMKDARTQNDHHTVTNKTAVVASSTASDIDAKNAKTDQDKSSGNQCQIDGNFDSHILALSWQSTFCELYGRKKSECRALSKTPEASQWQHFSLHGLWPNRQQCGKSYGYCASVKQQPSDFCRYPDIALTSSVRKNLEAVMPSARYGTCLERHEWWKHGTCRNQDPNDYFALAAQLTQAVNASSWVSDYISQRIGQKVTKTEMNQAFDNSFGKNAHTKMSLECAKGLLNEVRISLPKELKNSDSLPSLLAKAGKAGKGNCPERFTIDNAN